LVSDYGNGLTNSFENEIAVHDSCVVSVEGRDESEDEDADNDISEHGSKQEKTSADEKGKECTIETNTMEHWLVQISSLSKRYMIFLWLCSIAHKGLIVCRPKQ